MTRIALPLAVLGLVLSPHARGEGSPAAGKRFVYKEVGGKPLHLEVFLPSNHDPSKEKAPGVIFFHGGGWAAGSLEQFRPACRYLASRGMVAATANYRTTPKEDPSWKVSGNSPKRLCITDAKSAIRWMKQHAGEFGLDPSRLVAGGGSAGGHISVLATTNPGLDDPSDPKDLDTSVVAYLLFNPAFCGLGDTEDPMVDGLRHTRADFPPAIVFFGTRDGWWKTGWVPMRKALDAAGARAPCELWLAEGQAHGYWDNPQWNQLNLIAADRFLTSLGLLKGEPTLVAPTDGKELRKAE